jgi:hypothetical protein
MSNNKERKNIKFEDIKPDVLSALRQKAKALGEPVSLVDGFVSSPFSTELSDSVILGGPTVPMVMLVGDESGRLYFFALKALLDNIEMYR